MLPARANKQSAGGSKTTAGGIKKKKNSKASMSQSEIADLEANVSTWSAHMFESVLNECLFQSVIETHRFAKLGLNFLWMDEGDSNGPTTATTASGPMFDKKMHNNPFTDVFGQQLTILDKDMRAQTCKCPVCKRNLAASRFAPHLEKCLGMGRHSSRIASRRLAATNANNAFGRSSSRERPQLSSSASTQSLKLSSEAANSNAVVNVTRCNSSATTTNTTRNPAAGRSSQPVVILDKSIANLDESDDDEASDGSKANSSVIDDDDWLVSIADQARKQRKKKGATKAGKRPKESKSTLLSVTKRTGRKTSPYSPRQTAPPSKNSSWISDMYDDESGLYDDGVSNSSASNQAHTGKRGGQRKPRANAAAPPPISRGPADSPLPIENVFDSFATRNAHHPPDYSLYTEDSSNDASIKSRSNTQTPTMFS